MQHPFIEPRARNTDPATSHMAAKKADRFAASHSGRILGALQSNRAAGQHGYFYGLTASDIAFLTGLTVVQIDRRLPELQRNGLARVRQVGGVDQIRNGMRVWEAV